MEALLFLLGIGIIGIVVLGPIITLVMVKNLREEHKEGLKLLRADVRDLRFQLKQRAAEATSRADAELDEFIEQPIRPEQEPHQKPSREKDWDEELVPEPEFVDEPRPTPTVLRSFFDFLKYRDLLVLCKRLEFPSHLQSLL